MAYPAARAKAMKKRPTNFQTLIHTFVLLALSIATAAAQEKKPVSGTFWSSTMQMPPLPYLPFDDVPVTATGPGMFLYDDSKVDYTTLRAEGAKQSAQNASLQGEGEGGGGGAMMCMSGGLCLVPKGITNNALQLTIEGNDPALPYDLYARTNIVGTNAWTYVGRQAAGVTNIAVPLNTNGGTFFQLGTTYDGDSDGLPDAFECSSRNSTRTRRTHCKTRRPATLLCRSWTICRPASPTNRSSITGISRITTVRFRSPVNTGDFECWEIWLGAVVEKAPVEWAFSQKA